MSREHAYLGVLQTTVALALRGARADIYLRHFLLQQCLPGMWYTFSIHPKCKCSHVCGRGGIRPYAQDRHASAPQQLLGQWWGAMHAAWHPVTLKRRQCWGPAQIHPSWAWPVNLPCAGDPVALLKWCGGEGAWWRSGSAVRGNAQPGYEGRLKLKWVLLLTAAICSLRVGALRWESRATCPSTVQPLLLEEHPQAKHILQQDLKEAGIIRCRIARWQENKCFYAYQDVTSSSVM